MALAQNLNKVEVETLVPHTGKMFLLDRIVSHDVGCRTLISEVDITTDNLFFDEELRGIPSWVGFEYMAQSVSALSGIFNKELGVDPKIGFIVSVSNYTPSVFVFTPGKTVSVHVRESIRVESTVTFEGKIFEEGTLVATATLNAVEFDNVDAVK